LAGINFIYLKKKLVIISFFIYISIFMNSSKYYKEKKNIKVALCTMGKKENLYIKEFIDYYIKLGIDHIFIYDNNEPNTEKFSEIIDKNESKVSIIGTKILKIDNQASAFTKCYTDNINKFDWFLMVDIDEYLFIVGDKLKDYLTNRRFNKCDFIKFHWVLPTDNNMIFYDSRPLFVRFKPPYIKSIYLKSIIRGNISELKYWVHSPFISPRKNTTCNNIGKIIYYNNMNFEQIKPINIRKAYIIHFRYKSTEELVNKFKRGYGNWFKNNLNKVLLEFLKLYFQINEVSSEKVRFIENGLKLNLSCLIKDINSKYKQNKILKKFKYLFKFIN